MVNHPRRLLCEELSAGSTSIAALCYSIKLHWLRGYIFLFEHLQLCQLWILFYTSFSPSKPATSSNV